MKRLFYFALVILFASTLVTAQTEQMKNFGLLDPIDPFPESFIIQNTESDLLMFWIDSTDLQMSKSLDDGATWETPALLVRNTLALDDLQDLNAIKLKSGRILVTYKQRYHYSIYSDDNGTSWSDPIKLITELGTIKPRQVNQSSLSQTNDNKVWFVYNRLNVIYNIKSDDGVTWSERDTLINLSGFATTFGSINSLGSDTLLFIYHKDQSIDSSGIFQSISIDNGVTWNESEIVFDNNIFKSRPRVVKDISGALWLSYLASEETPFEGYEQTNIYYAQYLNESNSWEAPKKFTNYVGFDGKQNLSIINNKLYISFTSDRDGVGYNIWYGIAGETVDSGAPISICYTNIFFQNNYPSVSINMRAAVYHTAEIDSVLFNYQYPDSLIRSVQLFDDGLHNDKEAGDFIFGNDLKDLQNDFIFEYNFSTVDVNGNRSMTKTSELTSPFSPDGGKSFTFDNNNIWLPIDDRGVMGDVMVAGPDGLSRVGGWYDEARFLCCSGFALSGYANDQLWGNGIMTAHRMEHYLNGNVDTTISSNGVYVLRSSAPDFNDAWDMWKNAVVQGADFYDGNGDGLYNPVDLNGNGVWDPNEDKPDILGDITAWTVFNDGVPSEERNEIGSDYSNVAPRGIEIKQTAFSYNNNTDPKLSNIIFVRYNIENMGTVAEVLDSVYFSIYGDPDLGDYSDDLTGTDTTLNSTYVYNDGDDSEYGSNPPAPFFTFIQGPISFIPGETFIDNNGNGIYEDGIDTPLDSAYSLKGELLGSSEFPGAKNAASNSSRTLLKSHPTLNDPSDEVELRYSQLGKDQNGAYIDVCNLDYGTVFDEDCSSINPVFTFSGDPVTNKGWINTQIWDQRLMNSTGPFVLEKGKPIEIITAYIVGRGTDAINSITEAREIAKDAIGFYSTNFSYIPVGVKEIANNKIPTEFSLSQNYPNPFNPSTTIKYEIPSEGTGHAQSVQLTVYDILGREVATLVNTEQKPGSYEVKFNASSLTSGIYFYSLRSGSYIKSMKMILIK